MTFLYQNRKSLLGSDAGLRLPVLVLDDHHDTNHEHSPDRLAAHDETIGFDTSFVNDESIFDDDDSFGDLH